LIATKKFRYPTGVRPLLVEETARRRTIESRFVEMLESAGFDEVLLPIIDYVEPYVQLRRADAAKQSYRFVDREGDLVAIRSDFTPIVARALAPAIADAELPLRIFYRGDVIRCEATRLGANREMFQIGAEVIGDASANADAEVMRLAARCVASFGIRPLVVYNDVSIAQTLMTTEETRDALLSKRISANADPLVAKLASGTATLDDVAADVRTRDAANRLRAIADALSSSNGADFVLHLDDIDEDASYYTGLRFRVFDGASRTKLAQGGRYDTLYAKFGAPEPAIGFTFTIDDISVEAGS
jgi:ATP phosphoribosyltransferase regulatory subunit